MAVAAAALLPCGTAGAQTTTPDPAPATVPVPAPPAADITAPQTPAVIVTHPANARTYGVPADGSSAALPQAPDPQRGNALLGQVDAGVVRPAGSGIKFVAPSTTPGPGGFAVESATAGLLTLSLDDAVALGLQRNLRLQYERANQRRVRGYRGEVNNALLPNFQLKAAASTQEIDLAALGFKPSLVGGLLAGLGITGNIPTIVKVSTTSAQINLDQQLFNLPDFELYRAIKPEFRSVDLNLADSNEQLVQAVATAYLKVLADQASLENTIAQERSAQVVYNDAVARDQAGIGIRLDVLRAQVAYQQRQQEHVSADAQIDKDGIQLNRIMGLPAGQRLDLTDDAPFSELADLDVNEARATAFTHRSDLLALQQSILVANHEVRAVRYQRVPTLGINGFYGVIGVDGGLFHGVFTAQGSLKFPVFREAGQRGEEQTATAQLMQLRDQESGLKGTIDGQIRASLLDITSSEQLVKVAQSNAALAQQELADARDRFSAGVSDNLEVVDALASVTGAQAQLVSALYEYNVAKVGLARSTGVLETRYRAFLGM